MRAGLMLLLLLPGALSAYPNGTPFYVTDMVPACASCHAVATLESMPGVPEPYARSELIENKHYALITSAVPPSPYLELSEQERQQILRTAQQIDQASSIRLDAPNEVAAGREIRVTVRAEGGNGPVIGVMLVDRPLRFQARPISATGWFIADEPSVRGQNGVKQESWLGQRVEPGRNLGFVLVMDQRFDLRRKLFPVAEVAWTLRAPSRKGNYSLTAALLYGTENTDKAGVFQRPSGRILFSEPVQIQVK